MGDALRIIYFDSVYAREGAVLLLRDFGINSAVTTIKKGLFRKPCEQISVQDEDITRAVHLLRKHAVQFHMDK